jgi:hypothetical protein
MVNKYFNVKISMGDGKPVEDIIPAKNGLVAQDVARMRHPGARTIYVLGLAENPPEPQKKSYAPMDDILIGGESTLCRDDRIRTCLTMHKSGQSQRAIASLVGVGATTVRRWLKQYA